MFLKVISLIIIILLLFTDIQKIKQKIKSYLYSKNK